MLGNDSIVGGGERIGFVERATVSERRRTGLDSGGAT